jgi:futalosine hydrolase
MQILLVAATSFEITPLLERSTTQDKHRIHALITGPGMLATTWKLAECLATSSFDLAINAGIAGSFDPELPPGSLCEITEDTFGDFGAEDGSEFLPASEISLFDPHLPPFSGGFLRSSYSLSFFPGLKKARAITVNTVSGKEETIGNRIRHFQPQIESMEGAAFFYACLQRGIPCCQLRSVSNPIERRNKKNWNIPLAVTTLNDALGRILFHHML